MEYRCSEIDVFGGGREQRLNALMEQWTSAGWTLVAVTFNPPTQYMFFWKK
jgi:hypothetical protein